MYSELEVEEMVNAYEWLEQAHTRLEALDVEINQIDGSIYISLEGDLPGELEQNGNELIFHKPKNKSDNRKISELTVSEFKNLLLKTTPSYSPKDIEELEHKIMSLSGVREEFTIQLSNSPVLVTEITPDEIVLAFQGEGSLEVKGNNIEYTVDVDQDFSMAFQMRDMIRDDIDGMQFVGDKIKDILLEGLKKHQG